MLAKVTGVLWLFVAQRADVRWRHIKGHSNEPFNELADSVADAAIRLDQICYCEPTACPAWTSLPAESIALQYVFALPPCLGSSYPRITGIGTVDAAPVGGMWRQLPAHITAAPFDIIGAGATQPHAIHSSSCWLYVATYNVLTMRKTSAYHLFASQLRSHGLAITGVQEARAKETGTSTLRTQSGAYVVITSACNQAGQYGCALWIDMDTQWTAHGDRRAPLECDFAVLADSPRWLVVQMSAPFASAIFVVAHAPHKADASDLPAQKYWRELASVPHRLGAHSQRIRSHVRRQLHVHSAYQ